MLYVTYGITAGCTVNCPMGLIKIPWTMFSMLLLLFTFYSPPPSLHNYACYSSHGHQWWNHSPPPCHNQTSRAQADTNGKETTSAPCSSTSTAHQCSNAWPQECPLQDWIYWQHQVPARWRKGRRSIKVFGPYQIHHKSPQHWLCQDSWINK